MQLSAINTFYAGQVTKKFMNQLFLELIIISCKNFTSKLLCFCWLWSGHDPHRAEPVYSIFAGYGRDMIHIDLTLFTLFLLVMVGA